jgi:Fe-S oxidoreductase
MFTTRTRSFGGDIAGVVFHHVTQVLDNWLTEGKLKVAKKISGPVTYHDPCALARYCDELEAPRSVLSAILEEDLREMDTHGKMAHCCGAGGVLPVFKPELSRDVAGLRLREAEETGAVLMATACTRCDEALGNAQSNDPAGRKLTISNLVDLVARAACV